MVNGLGPQAPLRSQMDDAERAAFNKGDSDFVDEDHCALCSRMWPSERQAFRAYLDQMPLRKPVCIPCQIAFWRNLGLPASDDVWLMEWYPRVLDPEPFACGRWVCKHRAQPSSSTNS